MYNEHCTCNDKYMNQKVCGFLKIDKKRVLDLHIITNTNLIWGNVKLIMLSIHLIVTGLISAAGAH